VITWLAIPAGASLHTTPDAGVWGTNGTVWALEQVGHVVYLGGQFSALVGPGGNHVARRNLAAIDVRTGKPTSWAPSADAQVYALASDGTNIYAGGQFSTVNGVTRQHYAVLDLSGHVRSHNITVNGSVRTLAVLGNKIYLGGDFTSVGGHARGHLAALTPKTKLRPWTARANGSVHGLALNGTDVFAVGKFTLVNGGAHHYLVRLSGKTASILPWSTPPSYLLWDVTTAGGRVYAAEGGPGGHVLAWDASTGHQLWSTSADGDAQAVGFADGQVIAGGHFVVIQGHKVPHLAALDPSNGHVDTSWIPRPSPGGVWAIASSGRYLHVGGNKFDHAGGAFADHYVRFTL
jgi:outer membrane protein assembly factor BamB